MDRENFDAIITRYLDKFDYTNGQGPEEWFKWDAIACFQEHWDLDAPDFKMMYSKAVKEFSVLIDNGKSSPVGGLKTLLNQEGEDVYVREAFRKLYSDDGGDLLLRQKKAEDFIDIINQRISKYWPSSYKYPQSMRSAILFLTMRFPAQNYIYFWSRASNWASFVEYADDFGSGANFSLPKFYRMCDQLKAEIEASPILRECNDKRMNAARVRFDDNYHTLCYDIIYCATCYGLYVDIPTYEPTGVKYRIQRAKEREDMNIALQEAVTAEKQLDSFKMMSSLPLDLSGFEVKHSKFGSGTIVSLSKYESIPQQKLVVRFDHEEKSFIYPDVFLSKILEFSSPANAELVRNHEKQKLQQAKLEKEAEELRATYEKKKDAFNTKWIKKIHNEDILEDDT